VEVQRVVLTILAVTAMAASVLYASHAQRETAELHAHETAVAGGLLADVNRSDGALSTYAVSGDPEALDDYEAGLARVRRALATAATAASDDAQESEAVADQRRLVAQWTRLVDRALAAPAAAGRRAGLRDDTLARHDLVDELVAANERLQARQAVMAAAEDRRASWVPPVLILALSLLFGAAAAIAGYRARSEERRTTAKRLLQGRFGEAIQASDSQAEAHRLLKTHLERTIPGSTITVLNRNNSADRLEASTPLVEGSPLAEALVDARPRSCMAVRLSRSFSQGEAGDEVLSCELCGASASDTTCQPLLVGGEVIGAALVEHPPSLSEDDHGRIADSVTQASPALANLRNLAIAETRAATDALTGLPNRRAVDDTLLRMLAQAGRSFDPLSVILLDLDHFKAINDTYGHDRGDEVLAAFGTRLRDALRAGDFAGRNGGEEFVIFLPDTDRTGAVRLAEKLRTQMRDVTVRGVEDTITASFGIACFPDDAVDGATLMRSADRALYTAKSRGRDRIEASSTGAAPEAVGS
jgi:diguanylate cyclase (GGDEF)-like protein